MSSLRHADNEDQETAAQQGSGKKDGESDGAAVSDADNVIEAETSKQTSKGGRSGDEKDDVDATKTKDGIAEQHTAGDHPWRAIWDATQHAWYFWNSQTQETTWTNPLEAQASTGDGASVSSSSLQQAAPAFASHEASSAHEGRGRTGTDVPDEGEASTIDGIDADLAYLDPTLYAAKLQQASAAGRVGASSAAAYRAQGVFDTRTGKFVVPSASAFAAGSSSGRQALQQSQAQRQMSAFFDVEGHEQERKRHFEGDDDDGRQQQTRKRPTRKEVKMYKERAKEKKAGKHSWLRN